MRPLHPGLLAAALYAAAWCPAVVVAQTADSNTSAPTGAYDSATQSSAGLTGLPDSPGVLWAKFQSPAQQSAEAQSITPQTDQNADADKDKNNAEKLQRPVGTAAAEAPKVRGVTAAQPAGAAIAPAKQHRVRTIVLKVGAILGAGAAVGTVVALSAATPSKPPGAH